MIRWFFNNGTDHELTYGANETRREGGNGAHVVITSTLAISGTRPPAENAVRLDVGLYYCRVQVNDNTMRANSSQQFMAATEELYLQTSTLCLETERSFIDREMSCAVHVDTNRITTNPNPSTADTDSTSSVQEGTTSKSTLGEENQLTGPSQPSPDRNGGGTTLQVWIYVLVAVAAVFAMIIIILAIMCVGLCLRRSQSTMDSANCKLPINLVHDIDTSK